MIIFTIEPTENDNIKYKFTSDGDFTSNKDNAFRCFMDDLSNNFLNYTFDEGSYEIDSFISIEINEENIKLIKFFKDKKCVNPFTLVFNSMDLVDGETEKSFVVIPVNQMHTCYLDQFKKVSHQDTRKLMEIYLYF